MKEIGGYFELESYNAAQYHNDCVLLNSGCNALRYIIRCYGIAEMWVPYYTCPSVWQVIESECCQIRPYDIDDNFMPGCVFDKNAFVLYNNYFGVCGNNVKHLAADYSNLIVDNAQAFYAAKCGLACFYSPRKFFGLPDGGIVCCQRRLNDEFDVSVSYDLCDHLLKRLDLGAGAGYADFRTNADVLKKRPIQYMSGVTRALMGNINYQRVKEIRMKNFAFLDRALGAKNLLRIGLSSDDVPMVYPFKTNDLDLRQKLIDNKIFVAKYWPVNDNLCMTSERAQNMANTIIPLPIDQRYTEQDMMRIIDVICK